MPRSTQGKSFHLLCARFGAVIIVDFYIDDFIFALFVFMKDGKAVNYNGSEIIGLINLKYGKRTACRDNFFYQEWGIFPRSRGKTGQQRGINPNLYKVSISEHSPKTLNSSKLVLIWSSVLNKTTFSGIIGNKCYCNNFLHIKSCNQ